MPEPGLLYFSDALYPSRSITAGRTGKLTAVSFDGPYCADPKCTFRPCSLLSNGSFIFPGSL